MLLDPHVRAQLTPFIGQTATVQEAAAASGASANTTLKRVQRFMDAGLLQVAGETPRAGRPVKRYTAVADAFFVPFEASANADLESALAEREAASQALLRRSVVRARRDAIGAWGTRIYRDSRGRLQVHMAVQPEADASMLDAAQPAVLSAWRDTVMLSHEDAKALQRELAELLDRFENRSGPQRYALHFGLAPVTPDE
jgi:hypothetical protein